MDVQGQHRDKMDVLSELYASSERIELGFGIQRVGLGVGGFFTSMLESLTATPATLTVTRRSPLRRATRITWNLRWGGGKG